MQTPGLKLKHSGILVICKQMSVTTDFITNTKIKFYYIAHNAAFVFIIFKYHGSSNESSQHLKFITEYCRHGKCRVYIKPHLWLLLSLCCQLIFVLKKISDGGNQFLWRPIMQWLNEMLRYVCTFEGTYSSYWQRRTCFDYYISSVKDKQLKDKAPEISQDKRCQHPFLCFYSVSEIPNNNTN